VISYCDHLNQVLFTQFVIQQFQWRVEKGGHGERKGVPEFQGVKIWSRSLLFVGLPKIFKITLELFGLSELAL
jgi:hypothetical protein